MSSAVAQTRAFSTSAIAQEISPQAETPVILSNATHTIADLKEYFVPGEITKITDQLIIKAVVVANDEHGNFYKKIVLQDETGGIVFLLDRHDLFTTFEEGREISIGAKGLYISDYNGTIQVGGAPTIDKKGNPRLGQLDDRLIADHLFHGKQVGLPKANEVTIVELGPSDISTLVKLCGVQFSPNDTTGTLADAAAQQTISKTLVDCNANEIFLRTSGYAEVATVSVPDGSGCVTAIYGVYQDKKQLHIRTGLDLSLSEARCEIDASAALASTATPASLVPVISLKEDFSSNENYEPVAAPNWLNTTNVSKGRTWQAREYNGNIYAQATAYKDDAPKVDAWLVTPKINFSEGLQISFRTATAYNAHQGLEVLVSTDYKGSGDPSTATWTPLKGVELANATSGNNNWVPSRNVSLASYKGEGFVAFRYTGSSAGKASTFRVDDVVISKS